MANILAADGGITALMEGTTGATNCKISSGRFKYIDQPVREIRQGPSRIPRPFNIVRPELDIGSEELGDMTARTKMRGASTIVLEIAYGAKPHDQRSILATIEDDKVEIRRVLEYEANVALTSGWTGCSVIGGSIEDVDAGEDSPERVKILVITLSVSHRDTRISS